VDGLDFGRDPSETRGSMLPRSRRILTPAESRIVLSKEPVVRTLPSHWFWIALIVLVIVLAKQCES
jgi:hypothetical protein